MSREISRTHAEETGELSALELATGPLLTDGA